MIGLAQAGEQAMADRYTYLSMIGLFVAMVWGATDLLGHRPLKGLVLWTLSLMSLLALMVLSSIQVGYWRDSISLFEQTLRVTKDNHMAHNTWDLLATGAGCRGDRPV